MKKFVDISGFGINQSNRGNSALSYGAVSFLLSRKLINHEQEFIHFQFYRNFLNPKRWHIKEEIIEIEGHKWKRLIVPIPFWQGWLCKKMGVIIPFTIFYNYSKQVAFEAADYGGDGFSDIYGDRLFYNRLDQTIALRKLNIPLIILPQTIGPFHNPKNERIAISILKYAEKVFVRDDKYIQILEDENIKYEKSKDLSAYMNPQKWDIDIKQNPIGLNISGLAYSNRFKGLENQFDVYPQLIRDIIIKFQELGCSIYLIPHSYNITSPELNNDDMVACRSVYTNLENKHNVYFVENNLSSPQVKYLISKMTFFIGTRMHANFAAIYTNVPLFGLAYSYKFQGAFDANGLNGVKQTALINNIKEEDIEIIINRILDVYNEFVDNTSIK